MKRIGGAQFRNLFHGIHLRLLGELTVAESVTLREAHRAAIRASQGPYSAAMLRKMGHPYARRAPNPPGDPGIINRQSGDFALAWSMESPRLQGNRMRSAVRNPAHYAGYLDKGTRLMIDRPIRSIVEKSIQRRRMERIKRAIKRAFGG